MQIGNFILPTIWKQIKGFPNYEISICGQVRNFKTKRILNPMISCKGYYYIHLYDNDNQIKQRIHRLIALNFIPNINNDQFVDQINNNRLDNTISNLRWASRQQNNFNRSVNKNNKSGCKGLIWIEKINKWRPYIKLNNKTIHLGSFTIFEDAKKVRREKSKQLFGEFLNDCEK